MPHGRKISLGYRNDEPDPYPMYSRSDESCILSKYGNIEWVQKKVLMFRLISNSENML